MMTVYIAGPYSTGDQAVNTRNAIQTANILFDLGIIPFVPHLTHFWHFMSPRPYEDWMVIDFEWVTRCDCLLRLPGASSGADREVALAEKNAIPVFHSVSEVSDYLQSRT